MHFDVFNGDADGIISLVQLRLAKPIQSTLITGVKRDIALVKQVDIDKAHSVTVLDISLEKNIDAVKALLNKEINIDYVDHHRTGDIPNSQFLNGTFDTDANTCTALLVNKALDDAYINWAVTAAFGDNMNDAAIALAKRSGLSNEQQEQLKALGIYVNYNGYGRTTDDLHFHPAELYQLLLAYSDPLDLVKEEGSVYQQLAQAYAADMAQANNAGILADTPSCKVVELDDAPWARRVSGVFGNDLANLSPNKAHAVLTLNQDNTYTVSVRAPLNNKQGADEVCVQFPSGGGRSAAAGINQLPADQLQQFIDCLSNYYA